MDIGKTLIWIGLGVAFAGIFIWLAGRMGISLGKLPGDVQIQSENFSFYFPIVTSIIISLILTIGINLLLWLLRK